MTFEHGCVLQTISVIKQYKITIYSPVTRTGKVFAGCADTFLNIKQESSIFPVDIVTEAAKHAYIENWKTPI